MPRDLMRSDENKLVITDTLSGSELEITYRNPTTEEIVQYQNRSIRQKGNKVQILSGTTRVAFGALVVTGFRDGDFVYDGKPLSSRPGSPDYRPDWKDLLKETASDVLSVVGRLVFEGTAPKAASVELVEEEDGEGEILPFGKS